MVLWLITVGMKVNDTQELDERIRKCISYLTEEFFRDFYLTMRRHRVTASNVKELFYMCCIHFFLKIQSMCIILGMVTRGSSIFWFMKDIKLSLCIV